MITRSFNTYRFLNGDVIFALFFCFIWPLGGFLYTLYVSFRRYSFSERKMISFIVAVSFLLGYINTTRTVSSDTLYYIEWYNAFNRMQPIESFLKYRGYLSYKEPFFTILSILFNYLTLGSSAGYLFLCSFFVYSLQLLALYYVAKSIKLPTLFIIFLLITLAFCNPLFIQSIHAMRQMIATSLLMLAISRRVVTGKINWGLLIMAALTHSSVIVFLPVIILPIIYKQLTLKRFSILILFMWILVVLFHNFFSFLTNSDIDYVAELARHAEEALEHNQMGYSVRGSMFYNIPIMVLTIISLMKGGLKLDKLVIFYIFYIFLFFFILINPLSTELSIRYGFYIWSFIPYCLMAYAVTCKKTAKIVLRVVSLLMFVIYFTLLQGDPSFPNLFVLLLKPFPLLF